MVAQAGKAKTPLMESSPGPTVGRQIRVPKTADLIAGQLRRQIVRGQLNEGDALPPESQLMTQFGVSRPTLREAFRILESESLITVRRGAHGGARAQLPNPEVAARYAALVLQHRGTTLDDLYEAQTVIEPPCVALLAETRSKATLNQLRTALDNHDAVAGDAGRSFHSHGDFHSLLGELIGNQALSLVMGLLGNVVAMANLAEGEPAARDATLDRANRKCVAAHRRIVDLIEARDGTGAEQLWRRHLAEARDYLFRGDLTSVLDVVD